MPTLDGLKRYGVLGASSDDTTLKLCLDAAVEWFTGAGVRPPDPANPLYDMGVYMLALHYYDRRGVVADRAEVAALPYGVMSIVHQLRY